MQTRAAQHLPLKKNPLKNLGALLKLNPYAKTARRNELMAEVSHPPPLPGLRCLCSAQAVESRQSIQLDTFRVDINYFGVQVCISAVVGIESFT